MPEGQTSYCIVVKACKICEIMSFGAELCILVCCLCTQNGQQEERGRA